MSYNTGDIKVLKGLEGLRKRPSMYIGSDTYEGVLTLLREVIDNSIDEIYALKSSGKEELTPSKNKITVEYFYDEKSKDIEFTVGDNLRGIPIGESPYVKGKSVLEVSVTEKHAGGKFDNSAAYTNSSGLHGIGLKAVNALSSNFVILSQRDNKTETLYFAEGVLQDRELETTKSNKTGVTVLFSPDRKVLKAHEENGFLIEKEVLINMLETLAGCSGVNIQLNIRKANSTKIETHDIKFNSIKDLLLHRTNIKTRTVYYNEKDNCEIALVANAENSKPVILPFCNGVLQESGTHVTGYKIGLTRILTAKLPKKYQNINSDILMQTVSVCISIRIPDAAYKSQSKDHLLSSSAQGIVNKLMSPLSDFIEANPSILKDITRNLNKLIDNNKPIVFNRKEIPKSSGKLTNCSSKNIEERELYIVEGDSAGGTAKAARDKATQAILCLKGKPLNVLSTKKAENITKNAEIKDIISAIGMASTKYKFGKIIFATDADSDGLHIQCLLVGMFYKLFKDLLEDGKVYYSYPPLYRAKKKNKYIYIRDNKELSEYIKKESSSKNSNKLLTKETIISLIENKSLLEEIYLSFRTYFPCSKTLLGVLLSAYFNRKQDASLYEILKTYINTYNLNNILFISREYLYIREGNFDCLTLDDSILELLENIYIIIGEDEIKTLIQKTNIYELLRELQTVIDNISLTRLKGLGEMNSDELKKCIFDKKERKIKKIEIDSIIEDIDLLYDSSKRKELF